MSKILLTLMITLLLVQKGYCTCVSNQTQSPQDIMFIIEPSTSTPAGCSFQKIISPHIPSYYANPQPTNYSYCLTPNLPSNQNCMVQISIIGLTKPFNPQTSNCVIEGAPETIANSTFNVEGVGCYFNNMKIKKGKKRAK